MKIRVGKNIYFTLTVLRLDNTPEDFTDARNIRLVINRKFSSYQFEPRLTIVDNVISFEFPASPQATTGEYEMHLSYEKLNDESVTGKDTYYLDCCKAFMLVDSTCKEDGDFSSELPTITLKGVIDRNRDGKDGVTPRIDPETKHWLIGFEDTGIVAEGKDGLTPYIGENGNWWIGIEDTGKPSRGKAFEYSDFTPEEIYELQEPARDMIESLNTLDEAVTGNERQRIANEQARGEAETLRNESETLRGKAENTRVDNEKSRIKAEESRDSVERTRVENETAREKAETSRASAESTRVENENARKSAEQNRDTAEKGRVDAETKRVSAEETRVTEFNRLKSESETATQNATTQANYAKEQGDNVAGTVEEIKTAQEGLATRLNDYISDISGLFGKLAYRGEGQLVSDWANAEHEYLNSNGEFVASETNRVLYIDIDKDSVYRLYNKNLGSAGLLCLYDTDGKLIKTISTLPADGYYIFVGVAKIGISIFLSSINNVSITKYSIQDLTTVINTQQGNRALYVAAGAKYNETTGFYELNGLTDITENQMRVIYNAHHFNLVYDARELFSNFAGRTNFPFKSNPGGWIGSVNCDHMCANSTMEVFNVGVANVDVNYCICKNMGGMFFRCTKLHTVLGELRVSGTTNLNNIFTGCSVLANIKVKQLKVNISLVDSPLISLESLQYLITYAENTSPITITVHGDVYAKIQDETNTNWHALLALAREKQITIATA